MHVYTKKVFNTKLVTNHVTEDNYELCFEESYSLEMQISLPPAENFAI